LGYRWIQLQNPGFCGEDRKVTDGRGVDLIIDLVEQTLLQKAMNCAARDGWIVILAMMSSAIAIENIAPILPKRLRMESTTSRSR